MGVAGCKLLVCLTTTQQYNQNVTPLPFQISIPNTKMNGNMFVCLGGFLWGAEGLVVVKPVNWDGVTSVSSHSTEQSSDCCQERTKIYKIDILFVYNRYFIGWAGVLYCMNDWLHIMVFQMINEVVSWFDVFLCLLSSVKPENSHPTPREQN